uniref:HMG box domain-containing protein n=1 Tax=Fundulus heteroclitus TaxID=8078 RepID=A0A3Q2R1L9_FUNHE
GRGQAECGRDDWSKEDCLTLLERIRSLLPDADAMKYKTTESHFDWDKVCFGSFTGDMCRQKWQKVSSEVRKYRTMTELIVDAIEFVKNPYKGKKLKTHPDFPKKPLTPYFRFFMEKRAKYAKIHPEMSNLDLTKILSKKYKELPDKKKVWTGSRVSDHQLLKRCSPCLCFSCSKSTSQSSSGRRRTLRRTWLGSGEFLGLTKASAVGTKPL